MLKINDSEFSGFSLAIINVNITAKITERNPVTIEIVPSIMKSTLALGSSSTLPKYFCLTSIVNMLITVAKKPKEILVKLIYASNAVKDPLNLEISTNSFKANITVIIIHISKSNKFDHFVKVIISPLTH